MPPSAKPRRCLSSGTGSGLVGVKYLNSRPPDSRTCSGVWNRTSRTPGPMGVYSNPPSSGLYRGICGAVASDSEPRTPVAAAMGAALYGSVPAFIPSRAAVPNFERNPVPVVAVVPAEPAPPNIVAVPAEGAAPIGIAPPEVRTLPVASIPAPAAAFAPPAAPPRPAAPARDAPPNAPRPAMSPLLRSPVIAVCPAPTIPAAMRGPTPGMSDRPAPSSVGRSFFRNEASGRPV